MNSGSAAKHDTAPLVLHRPEEGQTHAAPFDFEAAYVASLPRLRVTEAHRRIERIRARLAAVRDRHAAQRTGA